MSKKYPIQVGHKIKKGLLAVRDIHNGGFILFIVWLNKDKEYISGDHYEIDDIDKVDTAIHFCDRDSVKSTIKALEHILTQWKESGGE